MFLLFCVSNIRIFRAEACSLQMNDVRLLVRCLAL